MGGAVGKIGGAVLGAAVNKSPFLSALSSMGQGKGLAGPSFQPTFQAPTAQPVTPVNTSPARVARRNAIASIESAGSGDYSAIGTRNAKLGRPLGRYQIMEANLPAWSQEVLGRRVGVQEFMNNPALQDQIFDAKMDQYEQKFGPEGAAQAWFGGPGSVGKTGRSDVHGTTVGGYGQRYMAALGKNGTQTPQTAGAPVVAGGAPDYKAGFNKRMFGGDLTPGEGETAQKDALTQVAEGIVQGGSRGMSMGVAQSDQNEAAPAVDLGAEEVAGNQAALLQRTQQGSATSRAEQRKATIRQRIHGAQV